MSRPTSLGIFHFDDAEQFLTLYDLLTTAAQPLPPGRRRNLRQVIEENEPLLGERYTTVLGRLTRLYDYVWPGRPDHLRSGAGELFRELEPGMGVTPTRRAAVLQKHLRNSVAAHSRLQAAVAAELDDVPARPVIRLGAPHSIALRVLSSALTGWREVFTEADIELQIANSSDVMARLNACLLDAVVSYGPTQPAAAPAPGEGLVSYTPLWATDKRPAAPAYLSRWVVICHPQSELPLKSGADANQGYWDSLYRDTKAGRRSLRQKSRLPDYNDLREIDLDEIDTNMLTIARVVSYNIPQFIDSFYTNLRTPCVVVNWHEEALALTRVGQAVAIVSEGTARRRGVTGFRITAKPEGSGDRAIGVYMAGDGTANRPEIQRLVAFLEQFLTRFAPEIRDVKAPRYGDEDYMQFLRQFRGRP